MEPRDKEQDRTGRAVTSKRLMSGESPLLGVGGSRQLSWRGARPESSQALSEAERIARLLRASGVQLAAIDRVLEGDAISNSEGGQEPLLLGMGAGARLLGVSRATFWRMLRAKRLEKVEVLPGSYRVRRRDVEAIAG